LLLTEGSTLQPLIYLVILTLSATGCVYVAQVEQGPASYAIDPDPDSRLGRMLTGAGTGPGTEPGTKPGTKPDKESGTAPALHALVIDDARLALTVRLDLIDVADSTLDVQYFIWQNDASGILAIDRILAAGDRGVRVRALIDDVQLEGFVSRLSALGNHPNIEIRIFNPFSVRLGFQFGLFRLAEFAIDGNRLNHRMHNKLMVTDNQLAILGGRNVGDDYFGLSTRRNFIDTDLLLSGAPVQELSAGFDDYWNSGWAVPVEALIDLHMVPDDLVSLRARIRERLQDFPELTALVDGERIQQTVLALRSAHEIDDAISVVDDPDVGWGDQPDEIAARLTDVALSAEREVLIVSPYLVLTPNLLGIADALTARGVKISVITNSLASNDVVIAHAAYARFRQTILDAGVALYEFRGDPEMMAGDPAEDFSLHSKYIVFDDDTVFIGSLNLDPRSLYLNTELGVVLKSESLATELKNSFGELISPANAWRVFSTEEGLRWESAAGTLTRQPAKNDWQHFRSRLMMLLPVSNQL